MVELSLQPRKWKLANGGKVGDQWRLPRSPSRNGTKVTDDLHPCKASIPIFM